MGIRERKYRQQNKDKVHAKLVGKGLGDIDDDDENDNNSAKNGLDDSYRWAQRHKEVAAENARRDAEAKRKQLEDQEKAYAADAYTSGKIGLRGEFTVRMTKKTLQQLNWTLLYIKLK